MPAVRIRYDRRMAESPAQLDSEIARLEALAGRYDEVEASPTERAANQYAVERAMAHVRGDEVLVLGAAVGAWAGPLLERFGRFSIVDAVQRCVDEVVRGHGDRVRGHTALFERFEPPRRYDTVVMGHVLEHVLDPVAVLQRALGWVQPGGRAVIIVPNALSIHRLVGVELGMLQAPTELAPSDHRIGHRRVYTGAALQQDIEAAGWRCALLTGLVLKPLSNAQMDAWDEPLRRAFFALGDTIADHACMLLAVCEPRERG